MKGIEALRRYGTGPPRTGLVLVILGAAVTLAALYGLSTLRAGTGAIGDCIVGRVCHQPTWIGYAPYAPPSILTFVLVVGLVPLAVLLLPTFWWVGSLGSALGPGLVGASYVMAAPAAGASFLQPWVVALDGAVLLAAATITATGFRLIRPRGSVRRPRGASPSPSQFGPSAGAPVR